MAMFRLKKPRAQITPRDVAEEIQHFRSLTPGQAELANTLVHFYHLKLLENPVGMAAYDRMEMQVLASIYLAIRKKPNAEVRRLVLRYAIDARCPVKGDPDRFEFIPQLHGRGLREWPTVSAKRERSVPCPRMLIIRRSFATILLDCIFTYPLQLDDMCDLIEKKFGRVPEKSDELPPETARFVYWRGSDKNKNAIVRLWINETEVQLKQWRDVHNLLYELCCKSEFKMTAKEIEESTKLKVSNPSQACRKIKNAMESAFHGADGWLTSRPYIAWADGVKPTPVTRAEKARLLR